MEYTQWVPTLCVGIATIVGLNPCCNGIYSMRLFILLIILIITSLNPCCNGIYSMSHIVALFGIALVS